MDDVSLPSEIPSELKAIDLLLKRAKELKSHDPVMAYWCKQLYLLSSIATREKRGSKKEKLILCRIRLLLGCRGRSCRQANQGWNGCSHGSFGCSGEGTLISYDICLSLPRGRVRRSEEEGRKEAENEADLSSHLLPFPVLSSSR